MVRRQAGRGVMVTGLSALIAAMETGAAELAERASHGDHMAATWSAHLLSDLKSLKLLAQTRTEPVEWGS